MNAQVSANTQPPSDRTRSVRAPRSSLRSTFPVWLIVVVAVVLRVLASVVGGRSREAERLLYARMPLKTFANSLRHGWLPEPVTVSVQALGMRLGSMLINGRVLSIVVGLGLLLTTRAIAAELGLPGTRIATALLLTNGVLLAQGFLADSAVQEALAAGLVALFVLRRVTRSGVISYVFLGFVSAGACAIEPRLVVLVGAVAGVATLLAWASGRRWEIVFLGLIVVGALGVAIVVAYRTKQAGDFATESLWPYASLSHLAVVLGSTVALVMGATMARRLSRYWIVVAWIVAGLIDSGWSMHRSGPPVWWTIPAIWLVFIGWLSVARDGATGVSAQMPTVAPTPVSKESPIQPFSTVSGQPFSTVSGQPFSTVSGQPFGGVSGQPFSARPIESGPETLRQPEALRQPETPTVAQADGASRLTLGGRFGAVSLGSLLTVISALGWVAILRPATNVSTLSKTLFNESRLGDQVIFLPSATRLAFEFERPVDRLLPVPEYPEAPWGGYPSSDPIPGTLPPAVAERIADTATRVWVVSDSAKPETDLGSIDALSFLRRQMPVVDEHSGSIRIQCFELEVAP